MDKAILPLMSVRELMQFVGQRVRQRRRFHGLSRAELAEKSRVSVPTIGRLEREGVATIKVLMKLAIALDATASLGGVFEAPTPRTFDEIRKLEDIE